MSQPNLQAIIAAAAGQADDFLSDIRSAKDAGPAIHEWITANHPGMTLADRRAIAAGVIAVLEREGFFEGGGRGEDSWDTDGSGGDEE